MLEAWRRKRAAALAQSGEAAMRRFAETRDPTALATAIEQLGKASGFFPDTDPLTALCLVRLGSLHGLRHGTSLADADFETAMACNGRVVAAGIGGATEAQALFGIGALHTEAYKRSGNLAHVEKAVDAFTRSLAIAAPDHPVRKPLMVGLVGMLCELTLKVPDPATTMERWDKAINAVPFRSLDQQELRAGWRAALGVRAERDAPPVEETSFLASNRMRLRAHAAANEAAALRDAGIKAGELRDVASHDELRQAIAEIAARFPSALIVFRGQTEHHAGRLEPSIARKAVKDEEELLWIGAVAENLRYGEPDEQVRFENRLLEAIGTAYDDEDEAFWSGIDAEGPAVQAILQHYGARTDYIDVTRSLDVALWFAHFHFHMRREVFTPDEFAERGWSMQEGGTAAGYDIAWYEPAWQAGAPAHGYLYVLAPRLPQAGDSLVHGEFVDLSPFPSPRMRAQAASLVYMAVGNDEPGATILAAFRFALPLAGAPAEVLDPTVERLFPEPGDDPLYGRILAAAPFWPQPGQPDVQTRRLCIPEYHSAPAARPEPGDWGNWLTFRGRDSYTHPAFVLPSVVGDAIAAHCTIAGQAFALSEATALIPSVPTMMIEAPIPEKGAKLDIGGRSAVFLEYDPLSRSLSPRQAAHHMTTQVNRRFQETQGSNVPLPGVRGAWVVQAGGLYFSRVFVQQEEDHSLACTSGSVFGFDPQFGWIVKEGAVTSTVADAIEMRAERAAFFLALGISDLIAARAWRVEPVPGSAYSTLRKVL